jgi:hypothetical protein
MTIRGPVCKIDHCSSADCRIIDNREGQETYSQTGAIRLLPNLWRWAGREVQTHFGTAPYRTAS